MRRKRKDTLLSGKNLMAGFIVSIMVLSVLGFMWGREADTQGSLTYDGIVFDRVQEGWQTEVGGSSHLFQYFPGEVDAIDFSSADAVMVRDARMMVFLFDPDDPDLVTLDTLRLDLSDAFATGFDSYLSSATTAASDLYALPVLGCANASQYIPFIYFTRGNETGIAPSAESPYCLVLSGSSGMHYVQLKDRLLYGMLGVIG
ncbi:hypothetical protein JXB02_02940 [Candidatus Woesearchaeota archaeon]|nr:hypothetical protein [Candidatus Woesearchaeota archaeon]